MNPNDRNRVAETVLEHAPRSDSPSDPRPQLAVVALLVFASGCAALVFQVAWMRELRLIFGATTAAVAAVLAIFMAGLGIGSAMLGKRADRAASPLRMYGLLEVAIAMCAAATPLLISVISSIYLSLGGQESLGMLGATALRLALATLVMAVPTFLMGGTLPAAVRAVTHPSDAHRGALGLLYGSNTLGAVFGAAAATFYGLEHLGTRWTLWTGCAIGLAAGGAAIAWSYLIGRQAAHRIESEPNLSAESEAEHDGMVEDTDVGTRTHLIYFIAFILGVTFFALELVWYRMLSPILGGTAFTFGLILCLALLGIGLGGIAYEFIFRRVKPSWAALAVTCGCEALFTIVPFALGDRLAIFATQQRATATSFRELVIGWAYVAGVVILPVAVVSGIQFPLVVALLGRGRQAVSRHLGMTYAWNTLGAITGSLVAGFGALPLLGALGVWQTIAGMLAVMSIAVHLAAPRFGRLSAASVAGLAIATLACLFATGPTAAWRHSGIGAGRTVDPSMGANAMRQWINELRQTLVWEADGVESSIGINSLDGLSFLVNGKSDGNALTDVATQIGISSLAAVLHDDPKTALVIGLGTGETAGWLAEMRNIERVDVVELEPAIDEMANRCRELNKNVLNHPRVRRIYNDGREFVLATNNSYDLVISEPSNPYRAGIASLYTTEFYQAVRRRLNSGGRFIQWLQAYEVTDQTVHTVLATARDVFDYVEVWQTLPNDFQLICSTAPLEYSVAELRERIESPVIKEALARGWNSYDLEGFLAHYLANKNWADEIAAQPGVPRNTDDRTLLEYRFAKSAGRATPFTVETTRKHLVASDSHRPHLTGETVDWNLVEIRRLEFNFICDGELTATFLPDPQDAALVEAFAAYRKQDFATSVKRWPAKYRGPAGDFLRLVLARCYAELARPDCLELFAETEKQFPVETEALNAIFYHRLRNTATATESLVRFYEQIAKTPWVISVIAQPVLVSTIEVARADRAAAEKIYPHLCQPFASYRYEYPRRLVRIAVAERLGPDRLIEALAETEPHIRWTAAVLQPRAQVYAATGHPLATRAVREWQLFQQNEAAK